MIKQFDKQKSILPKSSPKWVEENNNPENIFEPRAPLRKMIVMVDSELLTQDKNFSKSFVLTGLLDNKFIEYYKYSDKGPPAGIHPIDFGSKKSISNHPIYKGWAVLYPKEKNMDVWQVTYANEDGYVLSGVEGDAARLAYEDDRYNTYPDLNEQQQKVQRKSDILALNVAEQALNADIYITTRSYLHSNSLLVKHNGITLCTPDEALPLISLYLRAQNQFTLPTGHPNFIFSYGKWMFYWVGTRELLPEAWRWFSACVYHSKGIQNDRLQLLAGSLLNRVCRALQSRDHVHLSINRPTHTDTIEDALSSFDNTLTLLMGAVDVTARVANYVLNITAKQSESAWQRDSWYKAACNIEPKLSSLFATNSNNRDILTILRLLRNSVHGAALQGITTSLERDETRMLIGIPPEDEEKIIEAMGNLGGKESWGFKATVPGRNLIEPGVLIDKLFELVVKLLNEIMEATPVEKLPNLNLNDITFEPIVRDTKGFDHFSETSRKNIRWQLGF